MFRIIVEQLELRRGLNLPKVSNLSDPESELAQGKTLNLGCLDQATLQLIPGISDQLALNILKQRMTLLTEAKQLETVYGIGPSGAKRLSKYLQLLPCGIASEQIDTPSSEIKTLKAKKRFIRLK